MTGPSSLPPLPPPLLPKGSEVEGEALPPSPLLQPRFSDSKSSIASTSQQGLVSHLSHPGDHGWPSSRHPILMTVPGMGIPHSFLISLLKRRAKKDSNLVVLQAVNLLINIEPRLVWNAWFLNFPLLRPWNLPWRSRLIHPNEAAVHLIASITEVEEAEAATEAAAATTLAAKPADTTNILRPTDNRR